jgi:hypothetical protein
MLFKRQPPVCPPKANDVPARQNEAPKWTPELLGEAERNAPVWTPELRRLVHENGTIIGAMHFLGFERHVSTNRVPYQQFTALGTMLPWPESEALVPAGIPIEVKFGSSWVVEEGAVGTALLVVASASKGTVTIHVEITAGNPNHDILVADTREAFSLAALSKHSAVHIIFYLGPFCEGGQYSINCVRLLGGLHLPPGRRT